jgi:hypothetical protein
MEPVHLEESTFHLSIPYQKVKGMKSMRKKIEEEASINTIIPKAKKHRSIKKYPKKLKFNLTRFTYT